MIIILKVYILALYAKAPILRASFYLHTPITTFAVYIRCRRFKFVKCITTCRGGEFRAVLYIRSHLLAFLVALLSLLYNFPVNKYLSYITTLILDLLKRIRLTANLY